MNDLLTTIISAIESGKVTINVGCSCSASVDRPLNPKDIAKELAVSPATVIGWIRSRQLKASNLASGKRPRYVIRREDLDAFLKMRQPEPPVRRSKRNRAA